MDNGSDKQLTAFLLDLGMCDRDADDGADAPPPRHGNVREQHGHHNHRHHHYHRYSQLGNAIIVEVLSTRPMSSMIGFAKSSWGPHEVQRDPTGCVTPIRADYSVFYGQ
jgi:hypothetical protein